NVMIDNKMSCKVDKCPSLAVTKDGYCSLHKQRIKNGWQHSESKERIENLLNQECCLEGCDEQEFEEGLCFEHFHEVLESGHPHFMPDEDQAYDPNTTPVGKCALKPCKEDAEEGRFCGKHAGQLRELKKDRAAYNEDIKSKIAAFKPKNVTLDEIDQEDETFQVRQHISRKSIHRLARSIRRSGLLHPPVLIELPGSKNKKKKYRIVSGFCRIQAHKFLSSSQPAFREFEARIIDRDRYSHEELMKIAYDENTKRDHISFLEKALYALHLKENEARKVPSIANIIDYSEDKTKRLFSAVKNAANEVLTALDREDITFKHVQKMISLDKEEQLYWLERIKKEGLSVEEFEKAKKKHEREEFDQGFNKFLEKPPKEVKFNSDTNRGPYQVTVDMKDRRTLELFYRDFVRKNL
ncbi:MAG: ParB/RepB/Spo0J family partition protein, partial [Flavobacteriales bacterium]